LGTNVTFPKQNNSARHGVICSIAKKEYHFIDAGIIEKIVEM